MHDILEMQKFFTKKINLCYNKDKKRDSLRWTNSWHPHADGLTGETREMQGYATPAKESLKITK